MLSLSSGVNLLAPHHHKWVVIVFNLLPFFGGQFAPLFHNNLATRLKAYMSMAHREEWEMRMKEGFETVKDAAEAQREMREAQIGGVVATDAEQAVLEAALEGAPAAGGGGGGPQQEEEEGLSTSSTAARDD